jgi:hypothetical protein
MMGAMGELVPLMPERSSTVADDPAGAGARAARAAVGAVALTLGTMAEVIRQAAGLPEERPEDRGPDEPKEGAALVAGAALGAATEAMRTAASIVDAGARAARPMAVAGASIAAPLRRVSEDILRRWDETWEGERPEAEALAGAVASEATRRTVEAVLDQLDVTEIVRARVDLDAVVEGLDLDAIVDRIDVDAIVARVDVDAIADRIDVGRIIDRIDLSGLALEVIDRIDLPEIIRASTGAVASDTVRTVRLESISADQAIARFVDRLLGRERHDGPTEDG